MTPLTSSVFGGGGGGAATNAAPAVDSDTPALTRESVIRCILDATATAHRLQSSQLPAPPPQQPSSPGQRGPSDGYVAAHVVAHSLPDAVLEHLGEEHGGLVQFCQQYLIGSIQLRRVNGVWYLAKASTSSSAASSRATVKPKSSSPFSTHTNTHRRLVGRLLSMFSRVPQSLDALQQRWGLPSTQAAEERVWEAVRLYAEFAERLPSPTERVRDGRPARRLAGSQPPCEESYSPVSDGLQDWLRIVYNAEGNVVWVALGPSVLRACEAHGPAAADTQGASGSSVANMGCDCPAPHDLWRLSAMLSVKRETNWCACERLASTVTTFDPLHIALTYPQRLCLHTTDSTAAASAEPTATGEESSSSPIATAAEPLHSLAEQMEPSTDTPPSPVTTTITPTAAPMYYLAVNCRGDRVAITGLSFMLSEDEVRRCLTPNPVYSRHSVDQLRELLQQQQQLLRSASKRENPSQRKKAVKQRASLYREMNRRTHPHGSVFLCADVVAHYLYDHMESGRWYVTADLRREVLPNKGLNAAHMSVSFFDAFPQLFIQKDQTSSHVLVLRREVETADVQGAEAVIGHVTFSLNEVQLALLTAFFGLSESQQTRPMSMSTLYCKLPRAVFTFCTQQKLFPKVYAFVRSHPSVFVRQTTPTTDAGEQSSEFAASHPSKELFLVDHAAATELAGRLAKALDPE